MTVTLTNNLGTSLGISSIGVSGNYSQTNNCGTSLSAGGACTLNVTFSPTATGNHAGTLTITDSTNNSPQTVSLTGTGTALPNITGVSTTSGIVGNAVTVSGTGFGASQGASTVTFNGVAASVSSWSSTSISTTVPTQATTGNVVVTVNGGASNGVGFTVVPNIQSLSSTSGQVGSPITIAGTSFGATQGSSTVTFNGVASTSSSWSAGSITVTVPAGATSGNVVVTVGGAASSGVSFTVLSSSFVATSGQMEAARYGQTATRLTGGQVLIAGGLNNSGALSDAELYTLGGQTFAEASPMNVPRWLHTATLLNDGTVLIVGGSSLSNEATLNSAEIYDPIAGTFTLLPNTLNTARVGHTATLLSNGQVLIVGGYDPSTGIISDSELYDPTAQIFIDLGNTNTPRFHHAATLLQNGQVLITGGETDPTPSGAYNNAELFNPATWTFSPLSGNMTSGREGHAATLLNDGTVLITGGDLPPSGSLNTAELFNPTSSTFTRLSAAMTSPRIFHDSVRLNGGQVLLSGGENDSNGASTALSSAELYNPTTQTFTATPGNMVSVREHQTSTLLNDGTVLEDGGTDGSNVFNTAEIYTTSQLTGLVSIAISPASPSIPLGSQQLLVATATFNGGNTQVLSSVLWTTSSASVSNVSGDASDSGYVTTIAQGTATITATAAGVSGSATVTVPAPTLVSITVNPQSTTLPIGETQQFSATGSYSDGSVQDLTATATWTSSVAAASVSSGGLVAGVSQGNSTIQASLGSQSGSTAVTIGPPALIAIALSPANSSIAVGSTQQYQVTATYSDGSTQNVTNSVEWSALPGNLATLESSGLFATLAQGTATIQAALGMVSGSAILTIGPASLTSVSVSPNTLNIDVGGTQQFSAIGTYSNFNSNDLTSSSTWVSSNANIASVSATGFVTAISNGSVTITATSGALSGSATLTIGTASGPALNTSRYQHSSTLLTDGTLLIAGGINCQGSGSCTYLSSAESYNPDTGTLTYTGSLANARSAPSVLLPNGNVLIAGGFYCDSSGNCNSLSSAELYHPDLGHDYGYFSSVGNMSVARSGHTMTLLNNGQVLIAGGENCSSATSCTALSAAEIYDPVANTFTTTGNLNSSRFGATATELNQGLVLVAGGFDGANYPAAAELYDPSTGTFSSTGSLNTPRTNATATALNNGQILIAGGSTCASPGCPISSAELYNPSTGTFSVTGTLNVSRFNHSATLLTNGQVLIAGGYDSCSSTCTSDATAELYDPTAATFTTTQALTAARSGQTSTLLPSAGVIIAGGISAQSTSASTNSYQPSGLTPSGLTSIAIAPSAPSLTGMVAQEFVAVGTFSDNSTQTLRSAIWTSSNQTLTGITNDASGTGFIYPVTTGTTTITAAAGSVSGSTLANTTTLLVSLSITPQSPIILLGQNQQMAAIGTYSDGSTKDLTTAVTWTSSNTQVATLLIANPGLATAVGSGSTTIYANSGTVSSYTSVTVEAATPTIASLSATSGSVGTMIAIFGQDFSSGQTSAAVTFNGIAAPVLSWSNISIMTQVPSGATSGPVQVSIGGVGSNAVGFVVTSATQPLPVITGLSQVIGTVGQTITIIGSGFGSAGTVTFNGTSSSVSSWSNTAVVTQVPTGAQTGPVSIASGGQTSNGLTFTIIAAPTLISLSPGQGDVGTVVTINGTNFGTAPNGPAVYFNGSGVPASSWTSTQIVATVPMGTKTGPVAVKVGSLSSNSTTFTIVPTGSQSLSIFPANATLAIGQTVNLSLSDNLEHNITGATWSLSNDALAQLSTSNPPLLTAEEAGTVTVTATWNGFSATSQVTISAIGATLPLGTVVCSLPANTSGYTVQQIMQMVPSSGTTPDLVAVEDDGQGSIWLRALSSGCEQGWHIRVGSSPSGSGVDFVVGETPDNLGGVIVLVENNNYPGVYPPMNSLIDISGVSGIPSWRYDSPGALANQNLPAAVAVDQNGYIVAVEDSYLNANSQYSSANLIKIDPTTGSRAAIWGLPYSTFSFVADQCGYEASQFTSSTSNVAPTSGPISIGPDGSYYLQVAWESTLSWMVPAPGATNCILDDTTNETTTGATYTQLVTIPPSGSVSLENLPGSPSNTVQSYQSLSVGKVIPDGNGGALATQVVSGATGPSLLVTDFGGSSATATISNFSSQQPDMVLGDQGTFFTTDGNQIIEVNEASGNQLWTWQPSSGTVQIIAATAGGGVAVKNIVGNQEDVVHLDSNGNPTYDTWGTAGGSAGYGVLSNSSYWVNGLWVGVGSSAVIEGLVGNVLGDATGPYPFSRGNGHGQSASKTPAVINFLPSFIESQVSTIPNTGTPPNPPATADFPCYMDSDIRNQSSIQYTGGCTPPSSQTVRVNAQYVLRQAATVQAFRSALSQKLDALAFIGHSIVANINKPNEFSYGINFYYPLAPGKNTGDESSWDIPYLPQPGVLLPPQALPDECLPPNSTCLTTLPLTQETNVLLPMEKNQTTVQGLDPARWNYENDFVTTATSPAPPHAASLLVNKLFPDAHIFFIGACSLNPSLAQPGEVPVFLQMWDIHDSRFDQAETRDRAIILPTGNDVQLSNAASVWRRILFDMTVSGMTVQEAVADADSNNPTGQQFAVYGNQSVRFQ